MSRWSQCHASRPAAAAALLVLALLIGGAGAQTATTIDSLEITGLQRVDADLLSDVLRVHAGESLAPAALAATVRGLYGLGLFERVSAELRREAADSALILTLRLSERPHVRDIAFTGNDFLKGEDLMGHVTVEPGRVLDPGALATTRANIEKAYREGGYANATARPVIDGPEEDGTVAVRVHIEEGERLKVREVRFLGPERVSVDELRGQIKVKPSGFLRKGDFSREKLDEDVARLAAFYRNHGFKDAQVALGEPEYTADSQGVAVVFHVTEGPQYFFADLAWDGVEVVDTGRLAGLVAFREGEPYSQEKIDATIAAVANVYTERGHFIELRVDPLTTVRGDSVAVTFRVSEGPPSRAGEIHIVGNSRTREYVIRRELSVFPGDLLRRSLLLRSQRDVFATGFFEDVGVEFEPSDSSAEVDLVFRVKEKSLATAQAGAGYSSQGGLTGFVQFGHNNLFGRGQSIELKLERGSRREDYDISFTEPWVWGRPFSAGIDLYKTHIVREVYSAGATDDSYWHRMWGGGLRLGFPWFWRFPDYTRLSLGYSVSETRYDDYDGLPPETQALLLEGEGRVSRFFLSLYRNSTDNPFHPTLGTRTTWRGEFNGGLLGGDMDYVRLTLDHRQYFVPFWKPVLMLRWRAGSLATYSGGQRMPPAERFRLGGTLGFDMLRGYEDYYLVPDENVVLSSSGTETRFPGGRVMFGFTAELQFPIVDPLHGALFLDAGDTWNALYDVSLGGLKYGLGAGVTLEIPMLGPVGLYYAYGTETRRWKTHFAFGTQL